MCMHVSRSGSIAPLWLAVGTSLLNHHHHHQNVRNTIVQLSQVLAGATMARSELSQGNEVLMVMISH